MMWILTWLNVSAAVLNATFQFLVIYRYIYYTTNTKFGICVNNVDNMQSNTGIQNINLIKSYYIYNIS